jgi:beta-1,4-mannosyltransferase
MVLGDLGRSPRMLYPCAPRWRTASRTSTSSATSRRRSKTSAITSACTRSARRPGSVARSSRSGCVARVVRQTIELVRTLLVRLDRFDVLLVQNPPALPTLLVGVVAARVRGARLIVDWHNFGWAMLRAEDRPGSRRDPLARRAEQALARRADAHLCVSRAMQRELATRWGVPGAVVLHDRPAARFVATRAGRPARAARAPARRAPPPDLPRPPACS